MSLRGVLATKPCPERSEGPFEIAAGFALATTSSDCHALSRRNSRPIGSERARNDNVVFFLLRYGVNVLNVRQEEISREHGRNSLRNRMFFSLSK